MTYDTTFTAPEVMVPFKCDVHGWMNAYAGVLEHPFFAVTAEDGSFDLSGLPRGLRRRGLARDAGYSDPERHGRREFHGGTELHLHDRIDVHQERLDTAGVR